MYRKAWHVTHPKECSRGYVSNAKTKEVLGYGDRNRVKATDAINKITHETNQTSNLLAETYAIGKGTTNTIVLDIWLIAVGLMGPSFGADNVPPTHPVLKNQNLHPTSQATIMTSKP